MAAKKKPARKSTPSKSSPPPHAAPIPISPIQKQAAHAAGVIRGEKRIDPTMLLTVLSELTLTPRAIGKEDYDNALMDIAIFLADKIQSEHAKKHDQVIEDQEKVAGEFVMKPVNSSNVASIGYDKDTKTMRVLFNNGVAYRYADVAPELHTEIAKSDSIGRDIRKVYGHKTTKE